MSKTTHTWDECINEAGCAVSCGLVQDSMSAYKTGNCYTPTQLTDCVTPPPASTTDAGSGTTDSDAARIFASVALLLVSLAVLL
jgi:hypothetical protein